MTVWTRWRAERSPHRLAPDHVDAKVGAPEAPAAQPRRQGYTERAPEKAGWSPAASCGGRKVRAPQGRVLGNAQGGKPHGPVPQKVDRRHQPSTRVDGGKGETVR